MGTQLYHENIMRYFRRRIEGNQSLLKSVFWGKIEVCLFGHFWTFLRDFFKKNGNFAIFPR